MCWYIFLILGIWVAVCFLTHRYLSINKSNTLVKDGMKKSSNVMFVVAHPDDECMFFGPAITALTLPSTISSSVGRKKAKNVYLLCLSDGNADGLGKMRKEELKKSCRILGISDANVVLHSGPPHFEDNQKLAWDAKLVADTLITYIQKFKINCLVTFDEVGVSGHLNHSSLYHGVQHLAMNQRKSISLRIFILQSVNVLRKYSAFMDCIFVRPNSLMCVADWNYRAIIQNAMQAHASQYVWFRRLYVLWSRYLFINTFLSIDMD